ncbi:MAG: hypothetical protein EOM37_02850 [Proteobacteria bacterium]|jgi:NH3-dependent NAD+ synthetase/predicted amidohydrolase|nr:nitrilase-related carbon-nitrogen hydrolase [Alphaproteobacteria bacterium]NCC02975.1 hypothetical protein [Pseudomonadota bacterium]
MAKQNEKTVRVASVAMNQKVYDLAHNVTNFEKALQQAVLDGADLLSTEELSLVSYPADDYHQWNKDNERTWAALSYLAGYAADFDPNLVFTVGLPWHYANKNKLANQAEYNINNRPYNVQAIVTGGKVVAMVAKSILADGPAEYEPRQFVPWPPEQGSVRITLPDGSLIPFGKPVVGLMNGAAEAVTLTCEICAEAWPGIADENHINQREQNQARYLIDLAHRQDLSIVLNPSASKPEPALNKETTRIEALCKTGAAHCGLYVYTNYLGSGSGAYAAEGSQIYVQDGKLLHHGARYSFADVAYTSVTCRVPLAERGEPDVRIKHVFKNANTFVGRKVGQQSAFDDAFAHGVLTKDELAFEEYLRSISLWLRDYAAKQDFGPQGYVISLSGGKDSAYGALAVSMMLDMEVQENGLEGFFRRFPKLTYRDNVLAIAVKEGEKAGLKALKDRFLTCVYIPNDNSVEATWRGAQLLVKGGELPNGLKIEGIGGRFIVTPSQAALDAMIVAACGLDLDKIARNYTDEILAGTDCSALSIEQKFDLAQASLMRRIKNYVRGENAQEPLPAYLREAAALDIPTWARTSDDILLQNIQARVRLPIPWAIANHEGKIPLTTSNESEAVLSYTTAGGDMHMGGANPIGGVAKQVIIDSLDYFEKKGLVGYGPCAALYWINREQPSAYLRPVTDDKPAQTDEGDLGFNYRQSAFMERRLIVGRQQPSQLLAQMRHSDLFPDDVASLRTMIIRFARRWQSGQFKRIMAPLSPHVGSNVDPHLAVRSTVLGDHFATGCAVMTLELLVEKAGGELSFANSYGMTLTQAKTAALLNEPFKQALISGSIDDVAQDFFWQKYEKANASYIKRRPFRPAWEAVESTQKTFEIGGTG